MVISALRADRGGIGVGCGAADGACVRKACMLNRERESVVRLRMPGRCCVEMVKLCVAATVCNTNCVAGALCGGSETCH